MEELDNKDLMILYDKFCQGSGKAQQKLYNRTKNLMYRYVLSKSNFTSQDIEDVMHEIWIKLWKSCKDNRLDIGFDQRWRAIAKNTVIDFWRKHKKREGDIEYDEGLHNGSSKISANNDAIHEYDLYKSLKSLPEDQAKAWILKQDGYSNEEIAEITQSKVEAVRSKIRYAKKKIADRLN